MSRRGLLIALATLLLAGCAAQTPQTPPASLVWPGAPEAPRIEYVQSISRAEDLGIRKGWLQRLGDLLFGADEVRIVRPMAVVESGAALYVADPGMRAVHRFDRDAGRYELLRRDEGLPLPSPVGLARGSAGEVYVTDSSLRKVFLIRPDAKAAVEWVLSVELKQPTGIAFDAVSGRLFVVDTAAHDIKVFDRAGQLIQTLGRRGEGDGQFNFPTLLWRDAAGRLYVTDSLNFRVQVIDEQGRLLTKFGRHGDGSGEMARHKGVATDRHGHIYVVDGLLHALQVFDAAGRLLLGIGGQGRDRGEFWLPSGVYVGEGDMIYVADSYNQRVQVFRYIGGAT